MKKIVVFLVMALVSFSAFSGTERLFGQPAQGTLHAPQAGNLIQDPGFEAGTPNPVWTEASTNFGTPLCDAGSCGLGGGTGPHSGNFWAWFGGVLAFEEGSVSQSVTIPAATSVTLSFWLEMPACGDTGFLEVLVNGVQEFSVDNTDPDCGVVGYQQKTVDLTAYQGQTVTLAFHSIVQGVGNGSTNFFVDDVSLTALEPPKQIPALSLGGLLLLGGTLLGLVFVVGRRKGYSA